jgi:hypothetical protein
MKKKYLLSNFLSNENITFVDVGAADDINKKSKNIRKRQKYSVKLNVFFNRILKLIFGISYKSHLTY